MVWKNILKGKTEVISYLEDGLLSGYSLRFEEGFMGDYLTVVVNKFPNLQHDIFHMRNLHLNEPDFPRASSLALWKPHKQEIHAGVKALDLFLRELNSQGDINSLKENNDMIELEGENLSIQFSLATSCSARMLSPDGDITAKMCLSFNIDSRRPASGDSWLSTYLLSKIILQGNESILQSMADQRKIPQVVVHGYNAIVNEDVTTVCENCSSTVPDGDSQCENCGYYVEEPDTYNEEISVEEDRGAFISAYPIGWDCPYPHQGDEYVPYDESCENHEVSPMFDGPYYGLVVNGHHLSRTDSYMLSSGLIITNPDNAHYEYDIAQAKNNFDIHDLILDLIEFYGVEEALTNLNYEYTKRDNGDFIIDTDSHLLLFDPDTDYLREYNPDDEEEDSEKMQNLRNILNEHGMELDIDGATDDELNTIVEEEIENMEYALESLKESVPDGDEEDIKALQNYIYELREFLE